MCQAKYQVSIVLLVEFACSFSCHFVQFITSHMFKNPERRIEKNTLATVLDEMTYQICVSYIGKKHEMNSFNYIK